MDWITIDKRGANTAGVNAMVADSGVSFELRQSEYLNNLIEEPRARLGGCDGFDR